jgi:GcrA cell cycle regulator
MGQLVPGAWTLEQSNALVEYVKSGLSYKQSADAINERFGTTFTRNSAVGRGHRLGLVSPERPKKEPREYQPRRTITRIVRTNGHSDAMRMITSTEATGAKLRCVEIVCATPFSDVTGCRYPDGDGPFLFCNGTRAPGSSYCITHDHLCHLPARPRTDKYFSRVAA